MCINQKPLWHVLVTVALTSVALSVVCAYSTAQALAALAPNPDGDVVHVHGRVIDPSGKPVSGAAVSVVGSAWGPETAQAQVRSKDDGTFEISFRKSEFDRGGFAWEYASVAATAQGFGPGWDRWDRVDSDGNLVIQLAKDDVPIDGRILDLEGRPVKGASIRLAAIDSVASALKERTITNYDDSRLDGPPKPVLAGFIVTDGHPLLTDDQGRFHMTGVGADRTATLHIRGEGLAISQIKVVTRPQETETRSFQSYIEVRETVYGTNFDFNIEPGRAVVGTVRDAETGKPMAGIAVEPAVWTNITRSITDADGHYRIEGIRRKGVGQITAKPNDDQCYFMCDAPLADSTGSAPTTIDFALHRGVWITGKVTDAKTGKPVNHTRIHYLPYLSNEYVSKLPEFERHAPQSPRIPGGLDRYMSGADGSYRIVAAPGPAIVTARCIGTSYCDGAGADQIKCPVAKGSGRFLVYDPGASKNSPTAMKGIDVPADGRSEMHLDFQLDPGITIHITVVDPQGKPLVGATSLGDRPHGGNGYLKSNSFDALALRPDESRTLWVWYMPRKLGKVLTIKPSEIPSGKLAITLEPIATIKGRLIGPDGLPITNARMQVEMESPPTGTDSDGRFSLPVLPGREYHLSGIKGYNDFDTDTGKVAIRPGETKDLGEVHYKEYR